QPQRFPRESNRREHHRVDLGPAEAVAPGSAGAGALRDAGVLGRLPRRGLRMAAPGETPRIRPPDREKMAEGIRLFLEGCGVDLDDPNVRETPARVAMAWADEFLDGYD